MNKLAVKEVPFEIGAVTDEGRVGKNNEDAYTVFYARLQSTGESTPQPVQVAVVADGIGGAVAGEQASRLTIRTIQEIMAEDATTPISQRLEKAIKQANTNLYEAAVEEPALKGMGTTVVAVAIVEGCLFVAHAGDSRAYLIRKGAIHLLTKDHTWAQEAIDAGYLTPEEAVRHPNRNVIKRYLGIHNQVEADHQIMMDIAPIGGNPPTPQLDRLPLHPGDTVLLCSDGLTDVVNDQEILNVVAKNRPQKAADKLVGLANKAGGPDNITTVLMYWPNGVRSKGVGRLMLIAITTIGLLLVIGGLYLGLNNILGTETNQLQIVQATTETVSTAAWVNTPETATATPVPTSTTISQVAITPIHPISTPTQQTVVDIPSPTSTLIKPTETPTPSPTLSPAPTSAMVISSIQTTVPITSGQVGLISVTLISPENGTGDGGEQTFRWKIKFGSLEAGQAFELVFWKAGTDPLNDGFGLASPTKSTEVQVNLDRLDDLPDHPLQPGDYKWGIRLVQINPYKPLKYLGGDYQFRFNR